MTQAKNVLEMILLSSLCDKYSRQERVGYLCTVYGGTRVGGPDGAQRWDFPDKSAVVASGGIVDLGFPGCFCLQVVGHVEECDARA